jgi:hypothetical protein
MIVPVSKLSSHPKNQEIYSLSNIEDLESSISSLGLLERLVIDDDFQVISDMTLVTKGDSIKPGTLSI